MINFHILTEKDRSEAASIERRRSNEIERGKRIFNAKQRLFGIDHEALKAQIEEKRMRDGDEKQLEMNYLNEFARYQDIARGLDKKEKEEKKKIAEEVASFRRNYQKLEDRREFDLNDPNYMKNSLPVRMHDNDPRLGPSSAQKYVGEDLNKSERSRDQKLQIKSWLEQQMLEKDAAEKERKEAENFYMEAMKARDDRALDLERKEKECKLKLDKACSEFNKNMATEKEIAKKIQEHQDEKDREVHYFNILSSPMMTEDTDCAQSNLGLHKKNASMYKGMSSKDKIAFRETQLNHIAQNKQKKLEEERKEKEWQEYNVGIQKSIAIMDMEIDRQKKEAAKKIAEENLAISKEHKKQQEFINKIVYTNKPNAAYYAQFNTTTR